MRLLPEAVDELDPNIRWVIERRLQLIKQVACGRQASGTGAPGMEEAMERINRAVEERDRGAEDEAVEDYMRAEVREWWQDFPESQLLTGLYRRDARRRAGCGSRDSRRRPSHAEGLRVARELLADIQDTSRLDSEWEYGAVSTVLAAQWRPPIGVRSPDVLLEYIERSESSRVYFDALKLIGEELDSRDEAVPDPLARWRQEAAGGLRRRPAREPVPPHRPVNPAYPKRDVHIQFTIEILRRVGVPPRGGYVSGCRIVSEALRIREETVKRIWKQRVWKDRIRKQRVCRRPFAHVMRKHSRAIATRTGLSHYH